MTFEELKNKPAYAAAVALGQRMLKQDHTACTLIAGSGAFSHKVDYSSASLKMQAKVFRNGEMCLSKAAKGELAWLYVYDRAVNTLGSAMAIFEGADGAISPATLSEKDIAALRDIVSRFDAAAAA